MRTRGNDRFNLWLQSHLKTKGSSLWGAAGHSVLEFHSSTIPMERNLWWVWPWPINLFITLAMPLFSMIRLKMPTLWCLNLNSLDNIFKKKKKWGQACIYYMRSHGLGLERRKSTCQLPRTAIHCCGINLLYLFFKITSLIWKLKTRLE